MTAATYQHLPVDRLVTLRRNPQHLTPHQMDALVASIRRDGFLAPILVRPLPGTPDRWEVVSGNHRMMAAREAGLTTLPCVVADLDDRDAMRIAVNLNTVHGDPTAELLAPFLAEMDDDILADVHLPDALIADLRDFDAHIAERLAALEPVDAVNTGSSTSPIGSCRCPTCGRDHVRGRP